ncbi:hypothetical protein PF002_g9032 [Phytophthora fragariae]|uniref:GAF domain-containing protein n=1 Tax=Phytophthora fragariae TaxID=53985 RepID=A0A6A3ZQX7_9STRA|nr:hypothetical protein PF003_g6081 [Phytophthora fragariae]KAE8934222.1 hypothetical protein PF009_g15790 [Phytophthora fragariae]KAE9149007.1 hypothetical protein PF006_g6465 [Phytophthora fragariae]KAE9241894.1 hypothetical protein PF002_g9032 [Phytophthora fragariae]KAE9302739.1 hypothetical protein PF001_g13875 [Phytophthora fragariae]
MAATAFTARHFNSFKTSDRNTPELLSVTPATYWTFAHALELSISNFLSLVNSSRSFHKQNCNDRLTSTPFSSLEDDSSRNTFDPAQSFSTQHSDDFDCESDAYKPPTDTEMLGRARAVYNNTDFAALAAGPGSGGPWQRVEAADAFVVFKRPSCATAKANRLPGLEVMCAGRLDASLEEVSSVLRSNSEIDHANTMEGLYAKNFIFGSLDREVPCAETLLEEPQDQDDDSSADTSEQLNVKTSSFMRTTVFGRNEQWCFSDLFKRNAERDGFTISQSALPPHEATPGRVVGANARVDQLHGLNAACLVDQLPNRKGLRVVYNAWFEELLNAESSVNNALYRLGSRQSSGVSVTSYSSSNNIESSTTSSDGQSSSRRRSSGLSVVSSTSTSSTATLLEAADGKAQLRRLLSLAHGMTKLPQLIRRRRFGLQVPVDLDAVQVANTRCPCCTHSLAPVKMSLSLAASAIAKRSFRSMKMDTRRCYLCGYLVCIDCWSAEYMESTVGRVAAIVVCTRCHAAVKACDYSEAFAPGQEDTRGAVKVVADEPEDATAALLTDFLAASLLCAPPGGADRAAVLSVVRMLLRQTEATDDESDYDDDSDYDDEFDDVAVEELEAFLQDESQLPELESCVQTSAERREYLIDLPDDPTTMVPSSVIPSHDDIRLRVANDNGLLLLAHQLSPLDVPPGMSFENTCDVSDLNLLCQLAVRATACSDAFVTVMGLKHNHVVAATNPGFHHAAVPREQTMCQHTIMTTRPFLKTHPEADVRFHEIAAVKALSIRFYVGFPVTVPIAETTAYSEREMPVGTLCCIDSTARAELTRSQYATMKRLTDTASRLIQLKGRQLQQQLAQSVSVP